MKMVDDRTKEQKITHPWLVVGTDSFMSGWGEARNGVSYAAWACQPGEARKVMFWVEARGDMKRVRMVSEYARRYRPTGKGHCHIYVVDADHPALGRRKDRA